MALDLNTYFNTIKIRYSKVERNLFEINGHKHIKKWMATWMGGISREQHQQLMYEAGELARQADEKWWNLEVETFSKLLGRPLSKDYEIRHLWGKVPETIKQQLKDLENQFYQYLRIRDAHRMMAGMWPTKTQHP